MMVNKFLRLSNAVLVCSLLAVAASASGRGSDDAERLAFLRASVGTLKVEGSTISADGVLQHCGFVFTALLRDTNAKAESYLSLNGSFNMSLSPKVGPNYLLKLGIKDFPGRPTDPGFRPANAFVRAPNGKVPKNAFRDDGEPGYAIYGGLMSDAANDVLRGVVEARVLEVGFNREAGGRDVTIVLDLTVADSQVVGNRLQRKHGNAAVDEFITCSTRMFEDGVARVKK